MMRLLTTTDAALILGVSKAFLERDRWAGAKIPFIQIGNRAIRYDPLVLEAYIKQKTRVTTGHQGAG